MVAIVLLVLGLVLLDVAALLYGYDSRNMQAPRLRSDWHRDWGRQARRQ